jgi:hypothetical protein
MKVGRGEIYDCRPYIPYSWFVCFGRRIFRLFGLQRYKDRGKARLIPPSGGKELRGGNFLSKPTLGVLEREFGDEFQDGRQ